MNNLGFVFASPEAKVHWTTDRMWKRVGLNPKEFPHQFVCGPNLLQEIARSNVRAVVLFGEFPLQFVLGKTELLRWFHRVVPLKLESRTVHCVPCLSPDQLLPYKAIEDDDDRKGMRHPPRFTGMVVSCIKLALKVAEEGHTVAPVDYLEDPHPARFKQWVDDFYAYVAQHPDTILSSDIETAYKLKEQDEDDYEERPRVKDGDVLRISFAYQEGKAVSIPWHSEYKQDIKRVLSYTGMHCGWNCVAFDGPILEANDTPIGGFLLDGMDGWHLLQTDLDKGLEFVTSVYTDLAPWKHLSDSQPALYSCIDSDAALRCVNGIVRDLKARGLYERFLKEMTLMQVLKRAGETGNQINEQHRLELKVKLEGLLYTKLLEAQELVADKFKRRKLYKRVPKSWSPERVGECTLTITATGCDKCGKIGGVSVKHKCPIDSEWQKIKVQTEHIHYYDLTPFAGVEDLPSLLDALKAAGFNPSSPHQMKAYMRTHKHPLGKNWKTDKDSADVKHVKKLVAKYGKSHPIYAKTLEIRQIQKTLSTYINGLAPDEQGLVHCTYVNSPSTWRLGCRNFNAQNLGKRNTNQYAKEARQIIIPRSGNVLLTADSSSIEAVMVGRFMGSTQYEQLAKRGIHSYVTCKWLNLEFTPENVDLIKSQHVALYDTFKTINHGTNFGMGPYMMYMNEPDKFPTLQAAKKFQSFLFEQLPGLQEWHHELRITAKKQGYLDSPWGIRHYFYDVFTYQYDDDRSLVLDENGNAKVKLGKDANKVIAFKPQNSGGMFMRDNLLLLAESEVGQYMPAVVSIHDGYTLDIPEHLVPLGERILTDILTRPIAEMGGLRVGCEIEIGHKNFGKMEKLRKVDV